ncbi:MAG: hypothetical protein INR73_13855 [Williamsia sp.]|nr:hypothetical protein [Williamsia sp.]
MRFREIFRFEFAYQLRRSWPWLIFVVLVVLNYLMTRDASLSEALYEEFYVNAPFAIAKTMVFGSLIWLVAAGAIAGEAGARDVAARMHPLIYTTPVSKAQYLGGKFLAALAINALILLAVPLGILLAVYSPGVDPKLVGPFRPAAYLTAYTYIALPNAFAATAIQFGMAARSGRAMASYFGSFLLVFMGFFVASLLLFHRGLGTLLDPIGIRFVVEDIAHLWTTVEKSRRLLELKGIVLQNRLLWMGVAAAVLAITYRSFGFRHRSGHNGWWRRRTRPRDRAVDRRSSIAVAVSRPVSLPQPVRKFGFAGQARQALAIARTSFGAIAASWAGLALLVAIPLLMIPVILDQMSSGGALLVPTTARVINELVAPLSAELSRWVIVPPLIIFFAGELVWREQSAGLGEITDATPGPEWARFSGKFLGLALVLALFLTLLMMAGVLAQVILGYHHFEIDLYVKILLGLQLPEYLIFALLALAVHVLVHQKYIGHLVAVIVYVFIALSSLFGIRHKLLIWGASPGWTYTDMRGFGASIGPWLWFKLYWAAWALLLALVAQLLWVRGRESRLAVRLQLSRLRFTRRMAWMAGAATALVLILGGFVFYNTNVLNHYQTDAAITARQAAYERCYKHYDGIPQPQLTGARLRVEIYPGRQSVDIRGTYRLVNKSTAVIDSIHVATDPTAETGSIRFDRPAVRALMKTELGYQIYALRTPLRPGDSMLLHFRVRVEPHGFRESGADASIVPNGTAFSNARLPAIGYQRGRELANAADRRAYGLVSRPLIPSLYDRNPVNERGTGVLLESVIGTEGDQVAVAPGALRQTWTRSGRRYFRYSTDAPIGSQWEFFSARYAVQEAQWKDAGSGQTVQIRIFHHPTHTAHLDRMVRSIRASLDYYSSQFGPYRYTQLNVVERPGEGLGLHAEPAVLTYSEGFTFWTPRQDTAGLDLPSAVVAHEMGHQWTVPYANQEGAPVMSESLAWYYAIMAVEHTRGPGQVQQLLRFMREPYPYAPIRRGEPLLRGLDPYLSYRKGPFVLYALSRYIGETAVNKALRTLLEKHRPEEAPLANTLDLYRELQAVTPDSLRYLLHDLFEVNTFWDLKTAGALAKQTPAGNWEVTLELEARKLVVDSAGTEKEVPMNDWVELGLFAPAGAGREDKQFYPGKHRIRSGKQRITVMVPRKPDRAAIDPDHLLVWVETDHNSKNVKAEN